MRPTTLSLPLTILATLPFSSSALYTCNPTAHTENAIPSNSTETAYTFRLFQTLSNFAPDHVWCGVNDTITIPPGYKGMAPTYPGERKKEKEGLNG